MPDWIVAVTQSPTFITFVISITLTSVGKFIQIKTTPKAKIVWSIISTRVFKTGAPNPADTITNFGEMWISNIGRSYAEEVEAVFNIRPQHYEVFPIRHFTEHQSPDGSFTLKFSGLSSDELFAIIFLSFNAALPASINVRWKGGVAKNIVMIPQPIPSNKRKLARNTLLACGIFGVVYTVVSAFMFLI